MDTSDFARRLADKLIAQLKDGTSPWQKPWKDGQALARKTHKKSSKAAFIFCKLLVLNKIS